MMSNRWSGVKRPYREEDVLRLRGPAESEYTLAKRGAARLWEELNRSPYVATFGALTGLQAVQMAQAGLKSIYVSGWQVAADANTSLKTYPDQSLYPANSVPQLVERINHAFIRAIEVAHLQGRKDADWLLPIVADAEAGFGGNLNAYELMRAMVRAGAAGVHFEDQLASAKKCGHLGGKVLIPVQEFIDKLVAARLATDVCGVETVLIARTDANSAKFLSADYDERDQPFISSPKQTREGFHPIRGGLEMAIARGLAFAPYADLIWWETSRPDLEEARRFAEEIHREFPDKLLAYNCSPSFNWKKHLDEAAISRFQQELGELGYKFQFVTLAGFHLLNYATFMLARDYAERGMAAYVDLQEKEFEAERKYGYRAVRHQKFVGTEYFDEIMQTVTGGFSSLAALAESTEAEQFGKKEDR
uniref:Isocitrate lyase n=1 Tax=candidate division WWE3 bacterium TaxID=2053526 RepID=A0A831Z316_UNCKA